MALLVLLAKYGCLRPAQFMMFTGFSKALNRELSPSFTIPKA